MTQPATYGQLRTAAQERLDRLLSDTKGAENPAGALQVANARRVLHRAAAATLKTQSSELPPGGLPWGPAVRPVTALQRRAARGLAQMLETSSQEPLGVLAETNTSGPSTKWADAYAAAIDMATASWDLASDHLGPPTGSEHAGIQRPAPPNPGLVVLLDVARVISLASRLDPHLSRSLRVAAADRSLPEPVREALEFTARDCRLQHAATIREHARQLGSVVGTVERIRADQTPALTASDRRQARHAGRVAAVTSIKRPDDVVAATDACAEWLTEHTTEVSALQLRNIAALGSRVTALAWLDRPDAEPLVSAARNAWRTAYTAADALRTIHPPAHGDPSPAAAANLDKLVGALRTAAQTDQSWASIFAPDGPSPAAGLPRLANAAFLTVHELVAARRILAVDTLSTADQTRFRRGVIRPLSAYLTVDGRHPDVQSACTAFGVAADASKDLLSSIEKTPGPTRPAAVSLAAQEHPAGQIRPIPAQARGVARTEPRNGPAARPHHSR
jgi:hypothetical protein